MKTIHDELDIHQECDEESRSVHIYLDDDDETQIDLEFRINDEGKYQLRWMCGGRSFSPSYCFSKVSERTSSPNTNGVVRCKTGQSRRKSECGFAITRDS